MIEYANRSYILTSYYTLKTPYEEEAKRFLLSLERLNLLADVEGIPSQGDWYENTAFKPKFVLDKLRTYPDQNIVFVDIDAVIYSVPQLFETLGEKFDFGAHFRNNHRRKNELLSGTLFFANRPIIRQLILDWIEEIKKTPKLFEQMSLHRALIPYQKAGTIRVSDLPLEYCLIFDAEERRGKNIRPVIEHYQASRRYRSRAK